MRRVKTSALIDHHLRSLDISSKTQIAIEQEQQAEGRTRLLGTESRTIGDAYLRTAATDRRTYFWQSVDGDLTLPEV